MPSARYRRPAVWRSEREERAWVRAAQAGETAGVERLFERYWPVAYRTAYLIVHDAAAAEDIAQEAFLASIRSLGRFDRRRPFGPWLTRNVANRSIDHARARALRREAFDDALLAYAAADADGPAADPGPYSEEVRAALADLTPEHRAVIVLRYLLEYTPGEIAELLGLPRGTVNSRLRRALDGMAERLPEGVR
jgi:RNA polymerase sigma-70 factor (ECF subfamily)